MLTREAGTMEGNQPTSHQELIHKGKIRVGNERQQQGEPSVD